MEQSTIEVATSLTQPARSPNPHYGVQPVLASVRAGSGGGLVGLSPLRPDHRDRKTTLLGSPHDVGGSAVTACWSSVPHREQLVSPADHVDACVHVRLGGRLLVVDADHFGRRGEQGIVGRVVLGG